jgi:hypothetical protein
LNRLPIALDERSDIRGIHGRIIAPPCESLASTPVMAAWWVDVGSMRSARPSRWYAPTSTAPPDPSATPREAAELKPHGVTALAITPGFLRSQSMLQHFGVTEANWRDGGTTDRNFLESESPLYVGRAVAALASDPRVIEQTGQLLSSWELARRCGFTDYDGGVRTGAGWPIDWSGLPASMVEWFRTGTDLQLAWLTALANRTRRSAASCRRSSPILEPASADRASRL